MSIAKLAQDSAKDMPEYQPPTPEEKLIFEARMDLVILVLMASLFGGDVVAYIIRHQIFSLITGLFPLMLMIRPIVGLWKTISLLKEKIIH